MFYLSENYLVQIIITDTIAMSYKQPMLLLEEFMILIPILESKLIKTKCIITSLAILQDVNSVLFLLKSHRVGIGLAKIEWYRC